MTSVSSLPLAPSCFAELHDICSVLPDAWGLGSFIRCAHALGASPLIIDLVAVLGQYYGSSQVPRHTGRLALEAKPGPVIITSPPKNEFEPVLFALPCHSHLSTTLFLLLFLLTFAFPFPFLLIFFCIK